MAIPKKKPGKEDEIGSRGGGGQYSYYYESYWADQAAWGNYASLPGGGHRGAGPGHGHAEGQGKQFLATARNNAGNADSYHEPHNDDWLDDEEDEDRIIEWDTPVNVDAMNKEFMDRSVEAWEGIERDRWLYSFDTEDSIIPDFDKPLGYKQKKKDYEDELFKDLGDVGGGEMGEEFDDIKLVGSGV